MSLKFNLIIDDVDKEVCLIISKINSWFVYTIVFEADFIKCRIFRNI